MRAGTLGPVLHPRGLLFSVTCGVRVARGPRCLSGHSFFTLPETQSTTVVPTEYTTQPQPPSHPHPHTHTMAQHSSISPTWTKCLLNSRHCTECQPCGEHDRPTHLDRCPPPTTHITEYSCRHTSHMHTAQCAHSLSQTPTQIKQLPPQHSHRDTTGGPPHTSQLHTASHEHSALRD